MGTVPSVPTDPKRTLQLIDAGYSRTGTASFAMASEMLLHGPAMRGGSQILGERTVRTEPLYPNIYMFLKRTWAPGNLTRLTAYVKKWLQIYQADARGDKPRLMKLLGEAPTGFVACSDALCVQFLPELVELYPDAKVILVTRDPNEWWQSFRPIAANARMDYLEAKNAAASI